MDNRKKITLSAGLSTKKLAEIQKLHNIAAATKQLKKPSNAGKFTSPISPIGQAVQWLYKTFPHCFCKDRHKPLKCHIESDIVPYLDNNEVITKRILKSALRHYVYSYPYMNGLLKSKWRYDLDGNPVEELTEDHKTFAKIWLNEREKEKKSKEKKSAG